MSSVKVCLGEDLVPKCKLCGAGINSDDTVLILMADYGKIRDVYHKPCMVSLLDKIPAGDASAEPKRKGRKGLETSIKEMLSEIS